MLDPRKVKLGIAPIGWTNDDIPTLGGEITFEQCISEMALAGFTGTEVGNKYPRDPNVLKRYLDIRGLQVASAWFSSFILTKPMSEVESSFIEHRNFLYEMGAKVIVVSEQGNSIQGQMSTPLFDHKPLLTEDEWDKLIHGLNRLGELAKEKNMDIVYHHHMGTCIQTEEEIDRLMESSDASLVSLLYDTGHLYFSGEDYISVLQKHLPRIKHVHLKDVRKNVMKRVINEKLSFLEGVQVGVFTVPGDGSIDFKPIFDILSQSNYEGWMIVEAEQDPSKANPLEYAMKAREYIKKHTNL